VKQLAADVESRQDEDQGEADNQEPTPSWPLARHHRKSVMALALPVISRVCEPSFARGPPRNRSPTKANHDNRLGAVVGIPLACFVGAGLIRFCDRPG
jgi:hypothetical protein